MTERIPVRPAEGEYAGYASGTPMTLDEFMALPETNQIVELINGVLVVPKSPVDRHQRAVSNTYDVIKPIARTLSGSTVRFAPMSVVFDSENAPQPDLFWVSGASSRCKLGDDGYWYGAPDLVVEVFSPGTCRTDKTEKFLLYEKYGVREYWMLDPDEQTAEQWILRDGTFTGGKIYKVGDTLISPVLNDVAISVVDMFEE